MARGTRYTRSKEVSGVTFTTIPSGTTIDANGMNVLSYTVADYKMSGGNTAWAGTTLSIATGLSTDIKGFSFAHFNPGGVSVFQAQLSKPSPVAGSVSLALVAMEKGGGASTAASGGTIFWIAFGQ